MRRLGDCRGFSGRSMLRLYGIVLRQHIWAKKAGASSRTPQNRGEAPFGVRRLAAALAGAPFELTISSAQLVPGGSGSGKGRQRFCVGDDALHPLLEVLLAFAPQYCVFDVFGEGPQRRVRLGIDNDEVKFGVSPAGPQGYGEANLENQIGVGRSRDDLIAPPGFHGRVKLVVRPDRKPRKLAQAPGVGIDVSPGVGDENFASGYKLHRHGRRWRLLRLSRGGNCESARQRETQSEQQSWASGHWFFSLLVGRSCGELRSIPVCWDCRRVSGRSKQRPYGILLQQDVWAKKAGASSRTPQNRGEVSFGVRRLAAAFAGQKKIKRAG